jgi:hypothetical protein
VVIAAASQRDQGQGVDVLSSQQIANGSGGKPGRGAPHESAWDEANLRESVEMGDLGRVTELLVKGTNPNLDCPMLALPLTSACSDGHYSIVSKLMAYGADPFITKSGKRCSIQTECDRMVLEHLSTEGRCAHCGTAFMITYTRKRFKFPQTPAFTTLVMDANRIYPTGKPAALFCSKCNEVKYDTREFQIADWKTFHKHFCSSNVVSADFKHGQAALDNKQALGATTRRDQRILDLCEAGDLWEALYLVDDGDDLTHIRALSLACRFGDVNIARWLLEAGSDLAKITFGDGRTVLHEAALHGHDAIVSLLLEWNADVTIETKDGLTAEYFAHGKDHMSTVNILTAAMDSNFPSKTVGITTRIKNWKEKQKRKERMQLLKRQGRENLDGVQKLHPVHMATTASI